MAIFDVDKETPAKPVETATPVVDSPPEVSPKRRGRPPKSANGSAEGLPETPIGGTDSPPKVKRKRKAKPIDAGLLAKQIVGLHKVAATMTGLHELEVSEFEAAMLAESLAAVSREYDVAIDGKLAATLQLAAALGVIYVPRIVMIKKRAIQAKESQAASESAPTPTPTPTPPPIVVPSESGNVAASH